ncbi:GTA-gp10 family protein [Amphiplicatus metriothermophilus]|uniref:Phage tail tube protein, GTA-gp10 n=1 Tax=Amphiplicatus metriothermophilus TaxID=1519374 RepID=A0A239PKJ4_9PROT|nr:GTA-gp10 family protein [Amphiplicatus metriothermophilus]MBB5518092.1 hypothetical protein [Amphiplicatus metriothermophilus]SNT67574.1 Phage tail tube protein, GTA-gp10 [Amphiplicatus metriothermophilus]
MNDPVLIVNGEKARLRLTLGALARIEESLGAGGFSAMRARLSALSVGDLMLILHALLEGGGTRMSLEALRAADIDVGEAARAVAEAFRVLNPEGDGPPGKPAADSPGAGGSPPESSP